MNIKISLLFVFIFVFMTIMSLFLNYYFFPEYLSNYILQKGMLKNGDWIRYNELALSQLESMQEKGLKGWTLFPLAQDNITTHAISGLVSLFYYITKQIRHIFLVPFHSLIYSTTCIYLYFL